MHNSNLEPDKAFCDAVLQELPQNTALIPLWGCPALRIGQKTLQPCTGLSQPCVSPLSHHRGWERRAVLALGVHLLQHFGTNLLSLFRVKSELSKDGQTLTVIPLSPALY